MTDFEAFTWTFQFQNIFKKNYFIYNYNIFHTLLTMF